MRRRQRAARSRPTAAPAAPVATLIWGLAHELRANREGRLHPDQQQRIRHISLFDPWMRLAIGVFFIVFGLTQRFDSWQSWLPLAIGLLPTLSAINGLLARRRLRQAGVATMEGTLDEVRPHRAEAVAATLYRNRHMMFLLAYAAAGALPEPQRAYRFYAVFGVIRPPIVVAIEALPDRSSDEVDHA